MKRCHWLMFLVVVGCGDSTPDLRDAEMRCVTDSDCDDGVYCNGVEQCVAAEGVRGCVTGGRPCSGGCEESSERCTDGCVDSDGDGYFDAACGGDDCDDGNPDRYPANAEICDGEGLDDDCDPSTIGPDLDGDGYVDSACCNRQMDGTLRCGRDCDDATSTVNPESLDVCGNGDEDCDGTVDEDPERLFYRDRDGDGYGTPADTIFACAPVGSYVASDQDCDDDDPRRSPVLDEVCTADERDEDCDGIVNERCPCTFGTTRPCGTSVGECGMGVNSCVLDGMGGSVWADSCVGEIVGTIEVCNTLDDDCDGAADEDFECQPRADGTAVTESGTNMCMRSGVLTCVSATCTWNADDYSRLETLESCDYCDDTGMGPATEIAFASGSFEFAFIDDMPTFFGDATTAAPNTTLTAHSDPAPRVGGAFTPIAQPVGYGGALFEVTMGSTPPSGATLPRGDGWAMVALVDQGPLTLGPGGPALGVSRDHDGFSVEWRRYQEDDPSTMTDSLVIRRLSATGIDPVIVRVPSPRSFTPFKDHVELVIMPDRPGTPEDETAVSVRFFSAGAWSGVTGCSSSTTSCGLTIPAGTPMRFGLTAAVGAGRQETYFYRTRVVDGVDEIPRLTITGLCP